MFEAFQCGLDKCGLSRVAALNHIIDRGRSGFEYRPRSWCPLATIFLKRMNDLKFTRIRFFGENERFLTNFANFGLN